MNINFDEWKDSAVSAAQSAAQKAKELATAAKANLSIMAEEAKIRKAQLELGKLFYRDYAVGAEMDSAEYLPWCRKIDESNAIISDLRSLVDDRADGGYVSVNDPEADEVSPEEPVTDEDLL